MIHVQDIMSRPVVTDRDTCMATWLRGSAPNALVVARAMTAPVRPPSGHTREQMAS